MYLLYILQTNIVGLTVTYSSLLGDTQLVGGWCQRLSSILLEAFSICEVDPNEL
jgi:hypothetical protein